MYKNKTMKFINIIRNINTIADVEIALEQLSVDIMSSKFPMSDHIKENIKKTLQTILKELT